MESGQCPSLQKKVNGYLCRLGEGDRIFSSGSINADACLKPHRDSRDTRSGCGALLSWQVPDRPTQFHYIYNLRLDDPKADPVRSLFLFTITVVSTIIIIVVLQNSNYVAIDLGYGSCAFEVAGVENHGSTPPEDANRSDPSRLSYVLFQHKGLDRPHHSKKFKPAPL